MAKAAKSSGSKVSKVGAAYLMFYNLFAAFGWGNILLICVQHIAAGSIDTLWADVHVYLKVFQTMACLEIIHSMVGLVKSPWITTFMQVFSRVWTLWAVMNVAPPAQQSVFIAFACTSWALVEVPRYMFYAFNLMDAVPYSLFWLRYSLFGVLYPTGITGELGCMYMAAMYLRETKQYTIAPIASMPQIEISLFLIIVLVALTYIPGSPTMYGHMVKTRVKQFAALKSGKKMD